MRVRRSCEEIVDAVAAAAHGLFVQRGPAAVSVREIAAGAGVNLGLIHRCVGSKDDVIALVLDRHGGVLIATHARRHDPGKQASAVARGKKRPTPRTVTPRPSVSARR